MSVARNLLACACAALVTACATVPATVEQGKATPDVAFEAAGRLSARHRSEAAAANFRWTHRADADELELASPLGQTIARLRGDASSVRLELPDGRVRTASDWQSLTEDALGAPVPVRGLAWWMRGVGHPGSPYTRERNPRDEGTSVLRQDGWEIVYERAADAPGPSRIRMSYPDTEIRIVVDRWSTPSP